MNPRNLIYILLICSSCTPLSNATNSDPVALTVNNKTLIPEGVAVHPVTGNIYLSSLHHHKIVSVDKKGNTTDLISTGQNGYMWGLGMKFSGDGKTLWSCTADGNGKTALFAIDASSGSTLQQFSHDSARFLNDLVIMKDGRIFVTDTESGAVFVLQDKNLQLFIKDEHLKWANGIATDEKNKYLFVASGRYGVQRIGIDTKRITSATQGSRTDYAIDGLVYHNNKLYAAIGWPQDKVEEHRILRYHLDGGMNFIKVDTIAINQPFLTCPTTLAIDKSRLYALGNTSLGMYNRHNQKLEKISDSLLNPVVSVFELK